MKHAIFSSSMRKHAVTNAFDYSMTYDNNGNVRARTGNGDT